MARNAIIATTLMLIGAVLFAGPTMVLDAAAEDPSATVTRTGLETPRSCGDEFTVTLDIQWENPPDGNHFLSIEETYPAGWTVTSSDGNDDGSVLKFWTTNPSRPNFQYTLMIPETVADGTVVTFDGTYFDPQEKSVAGPNTMTISCGDGGGGGGSGSGPTPTGETFVSRQNPGAQECGVGFTMLLDLVWEDAGKLFIEERYPPSWATGVDNDSISDGGIHNFDENTIRWNLEDWQGITQVSYSITPGADDAGTFTFSGEWLDDSGDPAQSTGDTNVVVNCNGTPPPIPAEVQRSFGSPEPVECGEDLLVQFDITWNDATTLDITDTYPAGWSVHSITNGGTDMGGQVVWEGLTDTGLASVSYQASVPTDAEDGSTAMFDGEFEDDIEPLRGIPGDPSGREISCPDPGTVARSLPAVCTGSFTVTLDVAPDAAAQAWVVIEIPPTTNLEVDPSSISNGGVYNATSGEIRWASENGNPATLSYSMNITNGYDDGATWDGEFRFSPIMDARDTTTGDTTTMAECAQTHAFDTDENCVFDDSELFALIDAWKADGATDDELFSGIANWKFSPDSYCDK